MTIDLSELNVTAKDVFTGDDTFELVAGKSLKIETSPDGDDIYEGEVPAGKKWNVTVFLKIEETDA